MKEIPYTKNEHGQPIGDSVPNWKEPPSLSSTVLQGQYCTLVPLEVETYAAELFKAFSEEWIKFV